MVEVVATRSYIWRMLSVGIRELRNRLSEFVRVVQRGERVLEVDALPAGLLPLARSGHVRLASHDQARHPRLRRVKGAPGALELLDAERSDR